jgi:hypothetical protein
MKRSIYMLGAAAFLALPVSAEAQRTEVERSTSISVHGGAMNYDWDTGSGWAPLTSVRLAVPFGTMFTAELGGTAAWPRQDFTVANGAPAQNGEGDRALLLFTPEAQLQVAFPTGNIAPYLGVGGGLAIDRAERQDGTTSTEFMASAAGGLRMALANRIGGVAEVRVRGFGTDLDVRTTELTLGVSYQLRQSAHAF